MDPLKGKIFQDNSDTDQSADLPSFEPSISSPSQEQQVSATPTENQPEPPTSSTISQPEQGETPPVPSSQSFKEENSPASSPVKFPPPPPPPQASITSEPVGESSDSEYASSAQGQASAPRFSGPNIAKLLIGLFAVFAVIFIVFSLVLPNINKKEQKVELTVWDIPDSLSISNVLPQFEKENPNIQVSVVKQDIKDYKDKLVTRSRNGNGPDLFRFHNTWVLELPDILLPIPSDVITKDDFNKTFYPVVKHDLVKNGAIYGVPIEINTLSLFINSAMLKQANGSAPTNWNDFITTARSLTIKDQGGNIKTAGAAMGTFDNITHSPDIISMLMAQDGVNLDDISQSKDRVGDALNFYTGFALSDGSVWNATQSASLVNFAKGGVAMVFGYQKDLPSVKSASPDLAFATYNVPSLSGQTQTIASYYPLGVSQKSKHQKEALILLKFLIRKDVVSSLTLLPPARMDLPDKTNGGAKNAVSSYFAGETFDNDLNSKLNAHLLDAVSSVLNNNSADSATQTLILGFSQVLGQFKQGQ